MILYEDVHLGIECYVTSMESEDPISQNTAASDIHNVIVHGTISLELGL